MNTSNIYDVGDNLVVELLSERKDLDLAYNLIFDHYSGHFSDIQQTLEAELFQSGRLRIFALKRDGVLLGLAGLYTHFHALKEIKYAIIHSDYRGQGLLKKILEVIKNSNEDAVILARTDVYNKPMNISLVKAGFQFLSNSTAQSHSQIVWGLNSRTTLQPQVPTWLQGSKIKPAAEGDAKVLSTDKERMAEFLKQGFVPGMKAYEKYKLFIYMYALDKLSKEAK